MAGEWRQTPYGQFAADFVEDRLANLCEGDVGIQTGPFGSQLHQEDYVAVGTPIITVEHLGENRIRHEELPRVSDADRGRLSRYLLRKGDIVFSRVGSVDRRALVRDEEDGWMFSGRCLRIRPDPAKVDSGYLSYFFGLPSFKEHVRSIAVGATMPSLNTSLLSEIVVPHPRDVREQRAIAHILGTLDDKIELNRRMNETLEVMARAIFKSWFVDFDPVRAKAEGRDPGLPKHLADLFPDRLEESEPGGIPKGWHVRTLGDVLDVKHGFAFGGDHFRDEPSGDVLLTPGNFAIGGGFKEEKFKYYEGSSPAEFVLNEGDLLVTMTDLSKAADTLGYPAIVPPPPRGRRFLHNQRLGKIVILNPAYVNKLFLYQLFCDESYRNEILGSATGTTVRHTSPSRIKAFKTIIPSPDVMALFGRVTMSGHLRSLNNRTESHTLIALRDTLLPKLISGELRVKDAEHFVSRTACITAEGNA